MPYVWYKARIYAGHQYKPGDPFPFGCKPKRSMILNKVVKWVPVIGETDLLTVRAVQGDRSIDHELPPKKRIKPDFTVPTLDDLLDQGYDRQVAELIVGREQRRYDLVADGWSPELANEILEAQAIAEEQQREAAERFEKAVAKYVAEHGCHEESARLIVDFQNRCDDYAKANDKPIELARIALANEYEEIQKQIEEIEAKHAIESEPDTEEIEIDPEPQVTRETSLSEDITIPDLELSVSMDDPDQAEPTTEIDPEEASEVGLLTDDRPPPSDDEILPPIDLKPEPESEPEPEPKPRKKASSKGKKKRTSKKRG